MSALVPPTGPPRLIRFHDTSKYDTYDAKTLVAQFDRLNNILHVNRQLYDQLDTMTQHRVDKTTSESTRLADLQVW
jgi:hypothetical protein